VQTDRARLETWAVWVGIAISTRSADVRVAQQLRMLGSLPPLAILALMSLNVIEVSTGLAVGVAGALFVVDLFAWRVVSSMFDRERLVTGRRAERHRHVAPLTEYSEVTPVGREEISNVRDAEADA